MAGPEPRDTYNPVPSVEPQTGMPADYLNTRATPAAFGGQVGEALQKGGATIEQLGTQGIETALQYQQVKNETDANIAVQGYAKFASDQEMELRQKQGSNAVNALPAYQKTMQDKLTETANNIASPAARRAFLTDARNFFDRSIYSAGLYVGDEAKKGVLQSYNGKISSIRDFATLHFDDPKALSNGINDTVNASLAIAQQMGISDPNAAHDLVSKNVGALVSSMMVAQLGQGTTLNDQMTSLKKTEALFQQMKNQSIPGSPGVPMLDAEQQDKITGMLQSRDYILSNKIERQQDEHAASVRTAVASSQTNITAMVTKGVPVAANLFPTDAQIIAAYPKNPELAQEKIDDNNLLKAMSHYSGVLPGATPEQVTKMRQEVQPDPNHPETYARQVRLANALDSTLNIRDRQLKTDPAGYSVQNDTTLQNLFNQGISDTSKFGDYAHAVMSQQNTMGIPSTQQRLLPAAVSTQIVNDIQSDPVKAPGKIKQLEQKFGFYWPQVYRDLSTSGKLPAEYQSIANLPEGDGEVLAKVLAQNSTGKSIADLLPNKGGAAIKQNTMDNQDVFKLEQSLAASGASPQQTKAIVDSVTSLAYGNAYFKGQPIADAVSSAVKSFTGNYQYIGSARVPSDKFDAVTNNSGLILNSLSTDKVALPSGLGSTAGGTTGDEYISTLKAAPTWITSPKADALWLMDMGGRIVKDRSGLPISVPFDRPKVIDESTLYPLNDRDSSVYQ